MNFVFPSLLICLGCLGRQPLDQPEPDYVIAQVVLLCNFEQLLSAAIC